MMVCIAMCFEYCSQRCCLVISLGVQCGTDNFVWGSVTQSIGISRYTCTYYKASGIQLYWTIIQLGNTQNLFPKLSLCVASSGISKS